VIKDSCEKAEHKTKLLIESMERDASYAREKAAYYEELQGLAKNVDAAKAKNVFFSFFMLHEMVDVKKQFSKEEIGVKCTDMVAELKGPISALGRKVKEVFAVVRARTSVHLAKPAAKKQKTA
jgi:hypothetical protein